MLAKSITVFALAGAALAAPQPQNANDLIGSLTSKLGTLPTDLSNIDINSLTAGLSIPTALPSNLPTDLGFLSDIPQLPTSVANVLLTAVPASDLTRTDYACSATAASWYKNLPNDVKSALTSYQSAASSWASRHSINPASYSIPVCTETAQSGGQTTTTRGTGSTPAPTGSTTGGANAASSTNSPGAAPQATAAVMGSVVGIVGALGVMIAL